MHYLESTPNNQEVECRHCHKAIIIPNYPIHEVRCLQIMKKQQQKNRPQTVEIKPEKRSIFRFQEKRQQKEEKRKIEQIPPRKQQQKRQCEREDEDRIACFNCGYMQTFEELDSHPALCGERPQRCSECDSQFPKSLMQEHRNCCPGRRISRSRPTVEQQTKCRGCNMLIAPSMLQAHLSVCPSTQNNNDTQECPMCWESYPKRNRAVHLQTCRSNQHAQIPGILRSQGSGSDWGEQERYSISSLQEEQQSEDPFQQAMRGIPYRPGHRNNPLSILEEDEDFGYPIRNLEPNRHRQRLGHLQRQTESIRNITEQIAHLMRNIGNHNNDEGLNSQQIAQLDRVKYRPKNKEEKDLCTICYCDLQEGETVVNLRCNHQYHPECIITWVKKMAKCPVCKRAQTDRHNQSEDSDYDE